MLNTITTFSFHLQPQGQGKELTRKLDFQGGFDILLKDSTQHCNWSRDKCLVPRAGEMMLDSTSQSLFTFL